MDLAGLVNNILEATTNIDAGRKGFATRGMAEEGRLSYEKGISEALAVFKESQTTSDPQTLILAEYTFLTQELEFCHETDKNTRNSLTKAIQSFDDAFLALKSVDESCYKISDNIFPHNSDYRVGGFPKDSFHVALGSHKTRIKNMLRTPGVDHIEKSLLEQRLSNLSTAQGGYVEKQKKALS